MGQFYSNVHDRELGFRFANHIVGCSGQNNSSLRATEVSMVAVDILFSSIIVHYYTGMHYMKTDTGSHDSMKLSTLCLLYYGNWYGTAYTVYIFYISWSYGYVLVEYCQDIYVELGISQRCRGYESIAHTS